MTNAEIFSKIGCRKLQNRKRLSVLNANRKERNGNSPQRECKDFIVELIALSRRSGKKETLKRFE